MKYTRTGARSACARGMLQEVLGKTLPSSTVLGILSGLPALSRAARRRTCLPKELVSFASATTEFKQP